MRPPYLAALLAAAALLAPACASAPAGPAPEKESVNIGVIANFDQGGGGSAVAEANGVQIAISEYNADTDSRFTAVITRINTKGDAAAAGAATDAAIKGARIMGVIGPLATAELNAVTPILIENRVTALLPATTGEADGEGAPQRRLIATDRQEGSALGKVLVRRRSGGLVILHDGSRSAAAFVEGLNTVLEPAKRPSLRIDSVGARQDVKPIVANAMAATPAVVVYAGEPTRGRSLVTAFKKAGFKGALIGSHQLQGAKVEGAELNGVQSTSPVADQNDPALKRFGQRYRQRFGGAPPPLAIESYEGAMMILEALQEVDPDPSAVTSFFEANPSFLGDSKLYNYDAKGSLIDPPVWLMEMRDGTWRSSGRSDKVAAARRR